MARAKYEQWLTAEGLKKIEDWARAGLTDVQIAKNMGISRSTLNKWKEEHSDISDTLKRGKATADTQVENALYKKAIGSIYKETIRTPVKDPSTGEVNLVVTKEITKEVPPDTSAAIFWLKNRLPELYRDKQVVTHEGVSEKLEDIISQVKGAGLDE